MIIWLTGQSGAGKTTLAKKMQETYRRYGRESLILDGDEMRLTINEDLGFSPQDRQENCHRIASLAKKLNTQIPIIVSVIAPLNSIRDMVTKICDPVWVYVKRTMPERAGHFYEEPEDMFTVDNDVNTVEQSTEEIVQYILSLEND